MADGERHHSVISIASLHKKLKETKWLLNPSAGRSSCCIFKVPQCLEEINTKSYRPRLVSIGPYHHGEEHLEMMQQHKWRFLHEIISQTPPTGPGFDDYLEAVSAMEEDIRGSYSETLEFPSHELVEMMVLDGLFIIQVFCKVKGISKPPTDPEDPIFTLPWVFTDLVQDLFRFENQIPFSVLKTLFDQSKASRKPSDLSPAKLALEFFNHALQRPEAALKQHSDSDVEGTHLLDVLRLSLIPKSEEEERPKTTRPLPRILIQLAEKPLSIISSSTRKAMQKLLPEIKSNAKKEDTPPEAHLIKSADKLYQAGIKFKKREAMSFLDIRFSKGVIEIPEVTLDQLRSYLLLNFVAFENSCTSSSKHITTYVAFMHCLIRTPADAAFLSDNDIIENYLGTDKDVANFIRNMGQNVPFDIDECYLLNLFKDVNDYHRNIWHVRWAEFKFTYFASPWSFLSALAAVIILLFTAVQVFFAVYAYVLPPQ